MDKKYQLPDQIIRNLAIEFAKKDALDKPPLNPSTPEDYKAKVKYFFDAYDQYLNVLIEQNKTRNETQGWFIS